jgi:hypothetical protein
VYHFIALMLKQMHVVLAHPLRVFHALTAFANVNFWRQIICRPQRWDAQTQQQECEQPHQSPNPI